jgi:hypothetical protein
MIALALCFLVPFMAVSARDDGYKVMYDGGSLGSIKSGTHMRLLFNQDKITVPSTPNGDSECFRWNLEMSFWQSNIHLVEVTGTKLRATILARRSNPFVFPSQDSPFGASDLTSDFARY